MESYIIAILIMAAVLIVGFIFYIGFNVKSDEFLSQDSQYEMTVKFDDLSALTKAEETRLVEIKDEKLLARIDNAVPGTIQVVANTGAVKAYREAAKKQTVSKDKPTELLLIIVPLINWL